MLAFVSYLAVTVGLPLPLPTLKKSDQPFPCQTRSCGCQTAEQFWTGCCCFSPEERWAWARANHIEPPAYAERPSVREAVVQLPVEKAEKPDEPSTCCCCSSRNEAAPECESQVASSCCHKSEEASSPLSPGERGEKERHPLSPLERGEKESPTGWLIGSAALKCKGGNILWLTLAADSFPSPPLAWQPRLEPLAWLGFSNQVGSALPSSPLTPPPRSLFAESC